MTDERPTGEPAAGERHRWTVLEIARIATVALGIWFGLQLLWTVSSLVFLVFLATLFGLAVGRGADHLERFRIRRGIGAALIVFGTLGLIVGVLAWTAPTLIQQGRELQRQVPTALEKAQRWMDSTRGGLVGTLTGRAALPPSGTAPRPASPPATAPRDTVAGGGLPAQVAALVSGASRYLFSFVSNTVGVLTSMVLLVFLSIYIGAEPAVYRGWLLAVVPAPSRGAVRVVLTRIATVLRKWLVTQLIAMLVIGAMSTVALLVLGVKAAFALGFIAGLLEFVPTVGPILSAVPAVLMGFADSPQKALMVAVAYWGIQFVENNLLIPFLMRDEMDLPPAITLVAQALMTLVFGFLGLMVAVPLTAAVLVPLRMLAEREHAREQALRGAPAAA